MGVVEKSSCTMLLRNKEYYLNFKNKSAPWWTKIFVYVWRQSEVVFLWISRSAKQQADEYHVVASHSDSSLNEKIWYYVKIFCCHSKTDRIIKSFITEWTIWFVGTFQAQ